MKAKSIKGKSVQEIQSALDYSLTDGFTPTLAFVFPSFKQDRDAIIEMLNNKGISIFGATTSGEFIDGEIDAGSIAILLLDMHPSHFKILLENYHQKDAGLVAKAMTETAMQNFKNPAFILSHGVIVPQGLMIGEPIIRSIEEVSGRETTIWGGVQKKLYL